MAATGIAKVRPKHEAILHYILANPTVTQNEVAAAFDVTPAWLSQVVNSQAFKVQLAKRQDELFEGTVVLQIGEKLEAAASLALDATLEKLQGAHNASLDDISKTTDRLLSRLGFGTKANVVNQFNQVNNNLHVPAEVLARARQRVGRTVSAETLEALNGNSGVGETNSPAGMDQANSQAGQESGGGTL